MEALQRLDAATPLRTAREILITYDASGDMHVGVPGRDRVRVGHRGASILEAFAVPRSLRAGLAALTSNARSVADWGERAGDVWRLLDAGVLVGADGCRRLLPTHGFATTESHVRMLDDGRRTAAFLAAIRTVVRPGDVVIDLGTGTGILAVAAARAGARKVYAIEATDIAAVAEKVAAANGQAGVIEVVRGRSTDVVLPERADVLVTETIGNDPLAERITHSVADARERLLRSGARIIPERLELLAWLVEVPADVGPRRATDEAVAAWLERYGIDLSPLQDEPKRTTLRLHRPEQTGAWKQLGPAICLADIALAGAAPAVRAACEAPVTVAGMLGGVLLGFRATLAPGVDLGVGPGTPPTSWGSPVWHLAAPRRVDPGDVVSLTLSYDVNTDVAVDVRTALS